MRSVIGLDHLPFNPAMREAREGLGITRKELALRAGLPANTVGAYERLKQWPSEDHAVRLSVALLEPADELFPEELGAIIRRTPAHRSRSYIEVETLPLASVSPNLLTYEMDDPDGQEMIDRAMASLTPRQRDVIELRFGLNGPPLTLEQIAVLYNVTGERVRQIQAKALRHLRHPSRSRFLKDYYR